jgi:hypothetical protein
MNKGNKRGVAIVKNEQMTKKRNNKCEWTKDREEE